MRMSPSLSPFPYVRSLRARSKLPTGSSVQRLPLVLLGLILVPVALASCGTTHEYPRGASEVVLRIDASGGFVPVQYSLTETPGFSLYGDGTVIVTGPMIEIWPQPALPNLQKTTISEKAIDSLLAAAQEAGLFDAGVDYGQPTVTDMPTTTITINSGGATYTSSIYALGFGEMFDTEFGASSAELGLTSEQAEARAKVLEFTMKTGDLDSFTGTTLQWEQYEYESLAIFSLPYDPGLTMYDETVQPNHLDWPLGDLSTLGEPVSPEGYRRVVVSGDDLAELRPLLAQATQITLWKSGAHEYYLYFRPLLPDENT